MIGKKTLSIIVCIGIVATSIVGCSALTTTNSDAQEGTGQLACELTEEVLEGERHIIKGLITAVENGIDGNTFTVEADGEIYSVTMSAVTSEIIGDASSFDVGASATFTGRIWMLGEEKQLTVESAVLDAETISSVWNLRGRVMSIVTEGQLLTIAFASDLGSEYIVLVNEDTEVLPGNTEEVSVGDRVWISGTLAESDNYRIDSSVLLINPDEGNY